MQAYQPNSAELMSHDKDQITHLGGPAKVAEMLGYSKAGGVQRVQNWTVRGIPAKVKLENPELFPLPTSARQHRQASAIA